jgi:predicted nucleic acid-binding protein
VNFILDTNAFSELMKGTAAAVDRLAAPPPAAVGVPQPVLAEIAFGIERLPRSKRRTASKHGSTSSGVSSRGPNGRMP